LSANNPTCQASAIQRIVVTLVTATAVHFKKFARVDPAKRLGLGRKNNMSTNTAVYGLYRDRHGVDDAVETLRQGGFRNTDVSVLFPENLGSKDFAHDKSTKAPEGLAVGGDSVALTGSTLIWLAGIGPLAIPGIGPFIAAGPIMGLIAGVGVGGSVGSIVGGLVGMGIPEYEAKRYEGRIREGSILFSVHCDSPEWVTRAKDLLQQTGAEHIASAGEAKADYEAEDKPVAMASHGV
jgi:hypothetical protein